MSPPVGVVYCVGVVHSPARTRLIVRSIWRAFPELDAHSDEECRAFVRRATSRAPGRHLHRACVLIFFLVALPASVIGAGFVLRFVEREVPESLHDSVAMVGVPLALAAVFAIPALGALILRDRFLRRRLVHVLRDRGSCANCGYSLVGLPIGEDLVVACPECGHSGTVDEALTVLSRGHSAPEGTPVATGETRRVGDHGWMVMERPPRWPPERRKRWLKRSALVALAFTLILGVTGGAYELWVRMQVAEALRGMPSAAEVTAVIQRHRPGFALVAEPQGVTAILDISDRAGVLDVRVRSENEIHRDTWPAWGMVVAPQEETAGLSFRNGLKDEGVARGTALAELLLAAYEHDGLFDAFAAVRSAPREVRDLVYPPTTLLETNLRYLGAARQLALALGARMRMAISARDTRTAAEALESIRALARICGDQPFMVEQLVSASIEGIAARDTLRWLASNPDAEELEAMRRAWPADESAAQAAAFVLGADMERTFSLACVAEVLADPTAVRLAPFVGISFGSVGWAPQPAVRTPGTWGANRAAILEAHAWLLSRVPLEPWERDADPTLPPNPTYAGADLAALILGTISRARCLEILDKRRLEARIIETLLALECWRAAHCTYPEALNALIPALLPRVPIDPATGKPMGYARVDPATDSLGRAFILSSPGPAGSPIEFNDAGPLPRTRAAPAQSQRATPPPSSRGARTDPSPSTSPETPLQRPPTDP